MPQCSTDAVLWKNRRAYRLSNGIVEITVLLGGGHIADFRLCGSPINAIWESPWPTIEPQTFSAREHSATYGEAAVGKMLSGYTGHALALGYFGMPSASDAAQGLSLHGEAASSEWTVISAECCENSATVFMEVALPVYRLKVRREITLRSGSSLASIRESITNHSTDEIEFQWVEHAAFGEPLFTNGEASLFVSGARGRTWDFGYEGHELLANGAEFQWPFAPSIDGTAVDLSQPFLRDGTGFVASLLTDSHRDDAFVAVLNRRHALVAGYSFERARFPWIVLWEENLARAYPPWDGRRRVRGVEFGNSPVPLGLEHARIQRTLWETPVLTSVGGNTTVDTEYQLFASRVPVRWGYVKSVRQAGSSLIIEGEGSDEIRVY